MTIFALLSRLHDLGIRLWLEDESLRYDGPEAALTEDLRREIEAHTDEIREFLAAAAGQSEESRGSAVEVVPRDQRLPLSFAQQRFWFLCQLGDDTSPYNLSYLVRLRGALDPEVLQWSFNELIRHHETLRTTFRLIDGEPSQVIAPPSPFELPVIDVSSAADPASEAQRVAQREGERSFDLAKGPLHRFVLLRLGAGDHILVVTMLHIITDGWSYSVLFQQLSELYAARLARRPSPLPALRIQYADYAAWQRQWYDRDAEALVGYWRDKLRDVPAIDLPTDRPRPATQTFRGTRSRFEVSKEVTDGMRAVARAEGGTFFMAMLAAFDVLLARYNGQQDIAVGTPIANRDMAETEGLIGLFLNTLVLRTDLSGEPTFRELLRRVREMALAAFERQQMPFEQLVVELRPERDLSRNPLFQVVFNLMAETVPPKFADLDVEVMMPEAVTSMFDLSLFLGTSDEHGLTGAFEYNLDLFDSETIERMQRHYVCLLEEIVRDPDRCIWQLPMLAPREQAELLQWGGDTAASYPRDQCLHELIAAQAQRTPDAIAVVSGDDSLTYADLDSSANQLAHYLRSRGAGPGQLVGISLDRSLLMLVGLLGILKSGAAYVPLDPSYPEDRLVFIIEDAGIELLVTQRNLVAELPERLPELVQLDADAATIDAQPQAPVPIDSDPGQLAYVIFTSGSTGKPKGVQIEHRALVNFLCGMAAEPGLGADEVLVAVTTISFDIAGLELYLPLITGARVVVASHEETGDGQALAQLMRSVGCTVMQATPATWKLLIESGWQGDRGLMALCGGEALPRELAEQLLPRCRELWNMYGPTETTIWSMALRLTSAEGAVPVGGPIANTDVHVLDRHLQPVPIGVPGELYIGGDGLARGYWQRPDLTAEKFIAHPARPGARIYNTGDLVKWQRDGTIEFLGRVDHQVKVRGFRIELGEIEHVLAKHPAVTECAVVAQSKRSGDVQLVAFVSMQPGEDADTGALRSHLQRELPDYMVPAAFSELPEMPLTPNGKVDRKALMARDVKRLGASETYVAPRAGSEADVAAVWRDLLEVDRVGRNDNFFELGGHSLLIVQLRHRLQEVLGCELQVAEVFQYPTVAAMAERLTLGETTPSFTAVHERVSKHRAARGGDTTAEAIAVIGMAGRFPKARDLEQFWVNLRDGVEGVSFFTEEEVLATGLFDEATVRDPRFLAARAILDGIEEFDAGFFGIHAREAETMDPQQRLFLECAWDALENAGYDPRGAGVVGVWAGHGPNSYVRNQLNRSSAFTGSLGTFQTALANYGDFLTTRISYKLDLKGPSMEVNTACSTSLVAVVQACQSLLNYESDMALAGGVAIGCPQKVGYVYAEGEILSPDGHCRPFDEKGQGTVSGEGVGVVLLKRLSDAERDGDTIRAVIRGAALNNDGANKVGFTAPSVDGQAEVIARAQSLADVDPATITYVEAHGTATPLGDPIEVAALTKAFRAATDATGYCALGSVKSNIGHTDAAAGVAGLIKTVLSLEHAQIPPSLHFENPNPEIDFARSPFFVNAKLRDWRSDGPRRAAVSAFGLGGTNAHVVLEQGPEATSGAPAPRDTVILTLSAKTPAALDAMTANVATHLEAHPELDLADVAHTTQQSRSKMVRRRAIVAGSREAVLSAIAGDLPAQVLEGTARSDDLPVAFLFPGQGAQYVNMGRELYDGESIYRDAVDCCCELLEQHLGLDLRTILYPATATDEHSAQLQETRLTQPALFVVEYALASLWQSWGVVPDVLVGHSIGEYVAAHLAGVFTLEAALGLVAARGQMMQDLPEGDMLSVPLPEDEVAPLLNGELSLSAINGPNACVVSGPQGAVARLRQQLSQRELSCRVLHTSHAFHSAMMQPIVAPFVELVRAVDPQPAQIPCVSTVTGNWIDPADWADPEYWGRNLRQPVRFAAAAATLLAGDERSLLEVGPGRTLSALVRQQGGVARERVVVSSLPQANGSESDTAFVLRTLARLWLAGVGPNWRSVSGPGRRRVPLPTYPYERQRYWIEPTASDLAGAGAARSRPRAAGVAGWFSAPTWVRQAQPRPWRQQVGDAAISWLVFCDAAGVGDAVVSSLRAGGQPVVEVRPGDRFERIADDSYSIDPTHGDGYGRLLDEVRALGGRRTIVLHLWSVGDNGSSQSVGFGSLWTLARANGQESLTIQVVTDGLQDAAGTAVRAPERATVLGPCTVIPQEFPLVACYAVDIDLQSTTPAAVADLLLADALAGGESHVAYRGRHRWVRRFEPVALPEANEPPSWRREDGVYLITGGLGGIGLTLARKLAPAKFVLVSRSGLPDESDWQRHRAAAGDSDRTSRRIRAVEELRAAGAEVWAVAADLGSREAMQAVVDETRQRFGPIRGVVHAAGAIANHMIDDVDLAATDEIVAPKLLGTQVLEQVLAGAPLDFFLLCSSISTVLGGLGLADYVAANAYLDAFARSRDNQTPVIAAAWDAWADVGMAVENVDPDALTKEQRRARDEHLSRVIHSADGAEAFARLLVDPLPNVVVSPQDLEAMLARSVADSDDETGPQESAEETPGLSAHPRPDLPAAYVEPESELEQQLAELVREILGLDKVGSNDNFFDLGFDSLLAHRLIGRLQQRQQVGVPMRAVLESPTVAELAKYIEVMRWAASMKPQ